MGVILNRIKLVGSKGEKKVDALFDSGASFSCLANHLAALLGNVDRIPQPLVFETAKEGENVTVTERVMLDFYIEGIRLSDEFLIADGLSEDTLRSHEIYLGRFSDYLNGRGIADIRDMDEVVVSRFIETFARYSPSVIHNTLCSLRTFFHYLSQNGFVSRDFAYNVPHDGYRQRTKVPSAYPKKDVEKLLASIDRGNPKGKRDYAIILMAARLGLRAQDICDLSFNNLKWETNTIELLQEKTGEPIVLPLLEDVGLAIIDYLKYARPECDSTNAIFLRLIPPVGKLEAPTLHSIVTQHMRAAGIKIQDGKQHGPHALRHSLASALLEVNTPLPVISEVLGHTNMESTSVYLKIDVNQLRTCALEPPPFCWNKGEEVF